MKSQFCLLIVRQGSLNDLLNDYRLGYKVNNDRNPQDLHWGVTQLPIHVLAADVSTSVLLKKKSGVMIFGSIPSNMKVLDNKQDDSKEAAS